MQLAIGVLLAVLLTELINLVGKSHFTAMVPTFPSSFSTCFIVPFRISLACLPPTKEQHKSRSDHAGRKIDGGTDTFFYFATEPHLFF
jgi:hypothetical protein